MRALRPIAALLAVLLLAPAAPAFCAGGGGCPMTMMVAESSHAEMAPMVGACHGAETPMLEEPCCCMSPAEAPRSAQESPAAAPLSQNLEMAPSHVGFTGIAELERPELGTPPALPSPIPRGSLERLSLLSVFLI